MKRRALLLVLVAMLALSIVGLTACEEPETDITHIITAPQTTITTSVDGIPLVIEITNVEIILKDTPNSNICGNAQIKIEISNQVAFNIRVGFVSKGNNILVETKDLLSGEVSYQQLSLSDAMDLVQTNVGELPPEQSGDMAIDPTQLEALQEALVPIVGALDQLVDETMDDALVTAIKTLFDKSKKIGKAKYVFNVDRFKDLNDDLYTLPFEQVLAKYYGNGDNKYVDTLKQQAKDALQEPMSQVLKGLADGGITDVMLADLADAIVQIASQGENTSVGQMLGYSTTIEYLRSNDFQQTTLQSFLQSMDIPVGSAEIDSIFAQLENTLYQLLFGENAQESQQAYDQVNQLLDDIGQAVNLSIELKKDKINRAELSLRLSDIPVNASVEEGVEIGSMNLSTTVIVDAENKETSTYNYQQLENKWLDPTRISNSLLLQNGFEQQGKSFYREENSYYTLEDEYIEKYNVFATGRVREKAYTTLNSQVESQQKEVCNDYLLFTYSYIFDVSVSRTFSGKYRCVDSVAMEQLPYDKTLVDTYQEEKEFWVYINKETGDIFYGPNSEDIFAVHGKENIVYDGTTVKCSACNVSWQCDHENMQQSECGNGSLVDFTCPTCGFTEQRVSNEHIVILQTEELNIESYFDTASITHGMCTCGKITTVKLSTSLNRNFSNSYYIDDNGLSHKVTTSIYTNNLYVVEDSYTKYIGCTAENYKYLTVVLNGETVLDNYGGLEYIADSHELQVTYQDDNSNCADGYTVVEQCANCDYQNSYWSMGHVVKQEYLFKDKPDCGWGIIIRESCAICGKLGSDIGRNGHVQLPAETITDVNGNGVAIEYCLCGDYLSFKLYGNYQVTKLISAETAEFAYTIEGSTIKVHNKYQRLSGEQRTFIRTLTIYDGDVKKWEKSFTYNVEHDCPDYTQWTDSFSVLSCSQGCYISYRPSMHQYYRDKLIDATQGMDVCSGHEAFFCNCHECVNSQCKLVQRDAGDLPEKLGLRLDNYDYFYYECPDCGLGFLVQRFERNYLVDFNINIKDFTSVRSVYVIKDGKSILAVHESTFESFNQVARY